MPEPDLAPLPFARFEELARSLVALDVELGDEPRHRLAAYCGEEPLAIVDLRPFPPGGVQAPMVEALAGMLALGADRFAVALPARAWSMDDPIPPVSDDGDLRQRVLMLTTASGEEPPRSWVLPFDLADGILDWHQRALEEGPCEGWVPHALAVAAASEWAPDVEAAATQLARCTTLGHDVMLAPAGAALLDRDSTPSPHPSD